MRTADMVRDHQRFAQYSLDVTNAWKRESELRSTELELCREEKRILTESLDRSKDAIAAVIEQREKLAAKLREAKR